MGMDPGHLWVHSCSALGTTARLHCFSEKYLHPQFEISTQNSNNSNNSKLASFDGFHSRIFITQWETQQGMLHRGVARCCSRNQRHTEAWKLLGELGMIQREQSWTATSVREVAYDHVCVEGRLVGINDHDKGARNSYIGLHWAFWGIILQGIFIRLATVYIHASVAKALN